MKLDLKKIGLLLAAILICQLAGVIGSIFTLSSIPTWYAGLVKPSFSPPNWVFGPVWITLYTLMGVAAYTIYRSKHSNRQSALYVFGGQLGLNALWSIVFFGLHSILGGLGIIVLLWLVILVTTILFHGISKTAALLLIPYLAWVSFAAILNYYIWILN